MRTHTHTHSHIPFMLTMTAKLPASQKERERERKGERAYLRISGHFPGPQMKRGEDMRELAFEEEAVEKSLG